VRVLNVHPVIVDGRARAHGVLGSGRRTGHHPPGDHRMSDQPGTAPDRAINHRIIERAGPAPGPRIDHRHDAHDRHGSVDDV
jgi:hypothetical protein